MTRMFINKVEVDIDEDVVIPLNFSIADVKNPEKSLRPFTKTIVLPGTRNNNAFFSSGSDLSLSDISDGAVGFSFDPTVKYDTLILDDGRPILFGTAYLEKTIRKGDQKEHHVVVHSEFVAIFQRLGDISIAELGWSSYDHTLSITNIENTWSATPGSGVWYPLIDFGYTDNPLFYKTNQLRVYVYVTEILQKICTYVGRALDSDFFNTSLIKRLTWGSGGGTDITIDSATVAERQAHYTGDGTTTFTFAKKLYNAIFAHLTTYGQSYIFVKDGPVLTMTQVTDTLGQFDESTGEFVCQNTGVYSLTFSIAMPISYGWTTPAALETMSMKFFLFVQKNLATIASQTTEIYDDGSDTATVTMSITQELNLQAGDIVNAVFGLQVVSATAVPSASTNTFTIDIDFDNALVFNVTSKDAEIVDGDTVSVARFLPDMKASDFLKDLILMFNLYISEPSDTNEIKIEPLIDYYFETDDVDDWSEKLARGEKTPIEIKAASTIQGKEYIFRWAEDRDYYKQRYFNEHGHDYGDYTYNVPSTFKIGEKKYQLKSAQSCPVQIEGTDIIIPRIIKMDQVTEVTSPHKGKPRFFFNNGEVSCDPWGLINSDTLVGTGFNVYPQAHHLDDLTSPTFDLNFGAPKEVFYDATAYIGTNLVQEYHLQFLRELTGRDSKLVNAYFKLTAADLYHDFMRRLCLIDGVIYRKNEVKDYLTNSKELTKVELVRIITGNSRMNTYSMPLPKPPLIPKENIPSEPATGDFQAEGSQPYQLVDSTSADVTVTFDGRYYAKGQTFTFKKTVAANNVILDFGADTLDGASTYTMSAQWESITIIYDGTNYYIR